MERELEKIVSTILERSAPKAVVLFGSAINDSLTSASDIDLMVLFENDEEAEMARHQILSRGPLSAWPVDILFLGRATYRSKRLLGGVYHVIQTQGKVLFPSHIQLESL